MPLVENKSDINKCLKLQINPRLNGLLSAASTCVLGMRSLVGGDWLWTTGLTA